MVFDEVRQLTYYLDTSDLYSEDAPTVHAVLDDWNITLENGHATAVPRVLFSSVRDARNILEPILRAWTFQESVRRGVDIGDFRFQSAFTFGAVHDSNDHQTELPQHEKRSDDSGLIIKRRQYPEAPSIRVTPEMEAIWERYSRTRVGIGEPITSCAYFALTVLERVSGSRKDASATFSIDNAVLRKAGELSSTRGDLLNARKAGSVHSRKLSRQEEHWLGRFIRISLLQHSEAWLLGQFPTVLPFQISELFRLPNKTFETDAPKSGPPPGTARHVSCCVRGGRGTAARRNPSGTHLTRIGLQCIL